MIHRSQSTPASATSASWRCPKAVVSTLYGIFDVMNALALVETPFESVSASFRVEVVGEEAGPIALASGVAATVQRPIDTVSHTDIVIVPSVLLPPGGWPKGRHARLVEWTHPMHAAGAVLCSACSGIFLLAETGLFDGRDATVHFNYASGLELQPPGAVADRVHPRPDLVEHPQQQVRHRRLRRVPDVAAPLI